MGLFNDAGDITNIQRPNQQNNTGDVDALAIEQYAGEVEGTIERRSVLKPHFQMRSVRGTTTLTNFAVGESTLSKLTPGEAPAATKTDFAKASITVDTVVLARNVLPLLDVFQTQYDARMEIGREHGKKIAKFTDESFFIQAAKAAMLTQSKFSNGSSGKPAGHKGGSVQTMAAAGDVTDPALLMAAIRGLFVKMEQKDVIPREDSVILAFRPAEFYALQDAEQIINGQYVTADGTRLDNVAIFKAYGCPVVSSNNIPQGVITDHFLSNSDNGAAYDGDFSKLVAVALSPRALLAGETIPLESDVFYDKTYKSWFVDSHLSYAVTANRAEYAGAIVIP